MRLCRELYYKEVLKLLFINPTLRDANPFALKLTPSDSQFTGEMSFLVDSSFNPFCFIVL